MEKLREEDILLEVPKSAEITFTASMLGPEVRDRIREAFKLHQYEGQLEQLTLMMGNEGMPALDADWETVFKTLQQHADATFLCLL